MPFIDEQKPVIENITNLVPTQEQLAREQDMQDAQRFNDTVVISMFLLLVFVILTAAFFLRQPIIRILKRTVKYLLQSPTRS